jgi:endonuclease YncB( thermonuclease family)
MNRKVLLIFLLLLLITAVLITPVYANQEIKVMVDGQKLQFDTPPIIENGRVLVPLRIVFEALQAEVLWNNDTQTVTAMKNDKKIELKVGATVSRINSMVSGLIKNISGNIINLDVAPKIINGRVMVPLRFVSESFGADVIWDSIKRTAVINSQKGIPAFVTRIIDGDTIVVRLENDKEERVRFISVDAPETVKPGVKAEPWGPEASQFTKNMLEGKNVVLVFDVSERDRYGRLLAYVEVNGQDIGEALLREGLARVVVFPPNVAHVDIYREIEKAARSKKIGIWSD